MGRMKPISKTGGFGRGSRLIPRPVPRVLRTLDGQRDDKDSPRGQGR